MAIFRRVRSVHIIGTKINVLLFRVTLNLGLYLSASPHPSPMCECLCVCVFVFVFVQYGITQCVCVYVFVFVLYGITQCVWYDVAVFTNKHQVPSQNILSGLKAEDPKFQISSLSMLLEYWEYTSCKLNTSVFYQTSLSDKAQDMSNLDRDIKFGLLILSDWPQMGQIWDFLRSVSVHFASARKHIYIL